MDEITYLMSINEIKYKNNNINKLELDIDYILYCYYTNKINLDFSLLQLEKNIYNYIPDLYEEIIKILTIKEQSKNLLEIMPIIDEYLEYYSMICS